ADRAREAAGRLPAQRVPAPARHRRPDRGPPRDARAPRPPAGDADEASGPGRRRGGGVSRRYFGTDGIRGRVGEGPISADFVLRLGNAYGHALVAAARAQQEWRKPMVVIGKGTR